MKTKTKTKLDPVLILDKHRGAYFGYLKKRLGDGSIVKLENARHCFYWDIAERGHKGVYGLATVGPVGNSKIGPRVNMEVRDVVKIVECTNKAIKEWESAEW